MTTTEEDLYGALQELQEATKDLIEALAQTGNADRHICDRYDEATERAELVLARVVKG